MREKYDPGRKPGEGNEIGSLPRKSGGLASMIITERSELATGEANTDITTRTFTELLWQIVSP